MADGWREVRLGDCVVINDDTYSPKEAWPFINYLDTGNITMNRIADIQYLDAAVDKVPSRARRKVRPGDIVYSMVRPNQRHFGIIKDPPENFLASTGFAVLRGKEGIAETDFLYWHLAQDHIVEQLHTIAEHSTSAYPSIRPADLERLELRLPPMEEQRRIAGVLGCLDDKIELNRRMAETLEQMARALFRSWFVDFEPVRAKQEGRWSPGQSLPGLPAHLYEAFPERLEPSELGPIPAGWRVASLGDVIEVNPKRSLKKGEVAPHLAMADMPTHGHVPHAVTERPFGSGTRFTNGDTLVARITPCLENGRTAFVDFLEDGQVGWGSTEYIVLRPKPPLPPEFAYCLARSEPFREFAIQSMTGTSGRQRVPPAAVASYPVAQPSTMTTDHFAAEIGPLIARATAAGADAAAVSALRDSLSRHLLTATSHADESASHQMRRNDEVAR